MICALSLVVSLLLVGECLGSGYLDVQAVAFENPHGKDSSGGNCEFWPWDYCDHRFTFCLLSGGSCTTSFYTGTYWDAFYVDFGNPMAGGIANPMRFHFPDEYPGQFSIRTVVVDDDSGSSSNDPVDTITISRTMSPGGDTVEVRQAGSRSSFTTFLTLRFTVRCDTNYYGERCNVYCRATDSESGHYTCGSSGEKVCLEGWTNPTQHCLTPVCDPPCQYGSCISPDTCSCHTGYTGSVCDTAICRDGCQNGNCSFPRDCNCYPGYSGNLCEVDERFCERQNPCTNNGTCRDVGPNQYQCDCPYGYNGTNCDSTYDVCSVPDFCTNGGTCTPLGGVGQFECSCPMGYTGERCQDLVDNCVSGVCLNGGECINALNSFSCHCAQGFTGGFCEVDINECASNPCKNGGLCVDIGKDFECACPNTTDGSDPTKDCDGPPCLFHKCENEGLCSVSGDIGGATCTCFGDYVGPHCEFIKVDQVNQNSIPLTTGLGAGLGAGIPLLLLLCCIPIVLICVCCLICKRRRKERPESPNRAEQYAVYYDSRGEVEKCPEKRRTLDYINTTLDLSDEGSDDEDGYAAVKYGNTTVQKESGYDTLQYAQYSNNGFAVKSKTGTGVDMSGYNVLDRTFSDASRTSTARGRVSPPPNYTDLPSPLRRALGGGGHGIPAPQLTEENPYDNPPAVKFLKSEM